MEEKVNNDSVSSGERMRNSPNLLSFCLSIYGLANKLVDEYLKGVVTLQTTSTEFCLQTSVLAATATIPLHKVRNLQSEQKQLESCAKDSESLVCQVLQTLYL